MNFKKTTAYQKIKKLTKRIKVLQGGTAASKTIGSLMYLIVKAQHDTTPTLTSVVSESLPHLKRGAIRDFLNIMEAHGFDPNSWNKTENTYTFPNGSKIEFFSADQPGKVRGPRRDRLFINEANNIPFETYEQLEVRTREEILIDYNPVAEFWVHEHLVGKPHVDFLILTYKDNEALDKSIVDSIESRKERKGWWQVYGLGQVGELEGKIYNNWKQIDEVPHEARLERYGLDWGYTNDPCAIVAIYYHNGGWILDEKLYLKGLSNREIANTFKTYKPALIVADSAEPKSIDELRSYGLNVTGAEKGKDSVRHGIQTIQDQPISVTKTSTNLLKEYHNYLWMVDKNGKVLNEPEDINNHCMDAIRYALTSLGKLKQEMSYWDRIWEEELSGVKKNPPNLAR